MAESMGGDGIAGAMVASQIYNTSQAQQPGQQAPRPPRPAHAQTAPPQSQGLPAPRPTMQSVQQPISNFQSGGVQTPGRPYAVQNPFTMQSATMQMPQRPPTQTPMMNLPTQGQQAQYTANQPPPPPQMQGQYLASQQSPQISLSLEQTVINQQQTFNQATVNNENNSITAANGPPMAALYPEQPAVIQNNQFIIDNSSATPGSYFSPAQTGTPASSNEANITNISIENNMNSDMSNNMQFTQSNSSAALINNSMMTTTAPPATDMLGVSTTSTVATDYNTAFSADYYAPASSTDYSAVSTTNLDIQMQAMYMATDDVTTMYSTETLGASETVQGSDDWAVAAAATVTVDYSGGDWGDGW